MKLFLPACLALSLNVSALFAGDPAVTDPAEAAKDPDFAVQGEYEGEIAGQKTGMQVVAQGGGKFLLVAYPGGLPGAGWLGLAGGRSTGSATREGESVTGSVEGLKGTWKDGKIVTEEGTLTRVERTSPTLGAAPPEGAVVLFDGKNTDAWTGNGMTEDGLLRGGQTSKKRFQSYTLHAEFRTPWMPASSGQGRGNSGIYHQGRYETQVLDSFGLTGENNECGGIYTIAKPLLNLCLPPLTWQTYDVEYTAGTYSGLGEATALPTITVKLNGVLIHKDVKLPHTTTAAPVGAEGPEPGPIYLQDHGNPVLYRNIWIQPK